MPLVALVLVLVLVTAVWGTTFVKDAGWLGWGGCALILAWIVLAEPAAAELLRSASARSPGRLRRRTRSARPDAGP